MLAERRERAAARKRAFASACLQSCGTPSPRNRFARNGAVDVVVRRAHEHLDLVQTSPQRGSLRSVGRIRPLARTIPTRIARRLLRQVFLRPDRRFLAALVGGPHAASSPSTGCHPARALSIPTRFTIPQAACFGGVDDLAPERRERDGDQLEVRQPERDADDRQAQQHAGDEVRRARATSRQSTNQMHVADRRGDAGVGALRTIVARTATARTARSAARRSRTGS